MLEHSKNMAIALSNVQFGYAKETPQPVLNIPSWSVAKEEQIFIHGASGCGKSTLLNLLSGLLLANEGKVEILGHRLDSMSNHQRDRFRANHIGYVSQQFNLIPYLNAIDNIKLARHFANKKNALKDDIQKLLLTLNISDKDYSQPIQSMSIGQQQRIAIARALINQPELLIADEPTSSLDKKNTDDFMSVLKNMATEHNMTLIFVSHDLSLSQYFNRVEALNDISTTVERKTSCSPD